MGSTAPITTGNTTTQSPSTTDQSETATDDGEQNGLVIGLIIIAVIVFVLLVTVFFVSRSNARQSRGDMPVGRIHSTHDNFEVLNRLFQLLFMSLVNICVNSTLIHRKETAVVSAYIITVT